MRNRIIWIGISCILAATILKIAAATSPVPKANFDRNLIQADFRRISVRTMPDVRLAGFSKQGQVYMYSSNPHFLLQTTTTFEQIDSFYLDFDTSNYHVIKIAFSIIAENDTAYLLASNHASVYRYKLSSGKRSVIQFHEKYSNAVAVPGHSWILRGFDAQMLNQFFFKEMITGDSPQKEDHVSAPRDDAGISDDGMLLFDRANSHVIYLHYYHCNILLLDTNLNLLRTFHTIDGIEPSDVATTHSKRGITNSSPTRVVNRYATIFRDKLLVLSDIIAKNESIRDVKEHAAVDVYSIGGGKYLSSFYIPLLNGERPTAFAFKDSVCLVTYPSHIASFHLQNLNL